MNQPTAEDLIQGLADAIEGVWDKEWERAEYSLFLVRGYPRSVVKELAKALGRSVECVERWAALAEAYPQGTRALDRSPRTHQGWLNAANGPKKSKDASGPSEK